MTGHRPAGGGGVVDTPCPCLEQLQVQLAEHNTYIYTALWETFSTGDRRVTVKIPTGKIDSRSRKRALPVAPHFCPFCGDPYRPEAPVRSPAAHGAPRADETTTTGGTGDE